MIRIRRNYYNYLDLAGTGSVAALLGSTLIAGDILLYGTSQVEYGRISATNTLVLATN